MASVRRWARSSVAVLLAAALPALFPGAARAQADSDKLASALFEEGRKLMTDHRYAEACPKFAESERLAPSGGAVLNLADCLEKLGQVASAWRRFKEAAELAVQASRPELEKYALERAAKLVPRLLRLDVVVAEGADPDLVIRLDGVVVPPGEIHGGVPVDPGNHVIEATAPGKRGWMKSVAVDLKDGRATVAVPPLEVLAPPAPPPPVPPPVPVVAPLSPPPIPPAAPPPTAWPPVAQAQPVGIRSDGESDGSVQRTVAVVVVVAGVGGVVAGTVLGLEAKSTNGDALTHCRTSTLCDPQGVSLTNDARSDGTGSTIAFGLGAAALAGGAILWLTAPRASPARRTAPPAALASLRVAPAVGAGSTGVTLRGAW
jgi:hypothetical protein